MAQDSHLVERLSASFDDLELAIEGARAALVDREIASSDVLSRLDSYRDILTTQRNLTADLKAMVTSGSEIEIRRTVTLINSLSAMIVEDAQDIFALLSGDRAAGEEGASWC